MHANSPPDPDSGGGGGDLYLFMYFQILWFNLDRVILGNYFIIFYSHKKMYMIIFFIKFLILTTANRRKGINLTCRWISSKILCIIWWRFVVLVDFFILFLRFSYSCLDPQAPFLF